MMTEAQAAWLRKLRDEGPQNRPPRSPVGFNVMTAGWSQWFDRVPRESGDFREAITPAGLDALAAFEAAEIASWPPDMQARYLATVAMRDVAKKIADEQG